MNLDFTDVVDPIPDPPPGYETIVGIHVIHRPIGEGPDPSTLTDARAVELAYAQAMTELLDADGEQAHARSAIVTPASTRKVGGYDGLAQLEG